MSQLFSELAKPEMGKSHGSEELLTAALLDLILLSMLCGSVTLKLRVRMEVDGPVITRQSYSLLPNVAVSELPE